jgi:hypothetical protein
VIYLLIALATLVGIFYERYWRYRWVKDGYSPPSPVMRWATGIWGAIFAGLTAWFFSGLFSARH